MLYFARIGSKMDDISRVGALERELARPPPDESKMPEKVDEDQPSGSDEHGGTDECDGGPTDECGGTTDECCGPTDGDTTDEYGGTTDEYSCMTDDSSSSDYTGATIIILRYNNYVSTCTLAGSDGSWDWEYVQDETSQIISQSQPMFSKGGHSYTPEGWVRKYKRRKSLKATAAVAKKLKFAGEEAV